MIFDIETFNLTKNFGDFAAVRRLELQVPRGVIFGFLGANGSGKSTTVKMLTGILSPSVGDAIIGGFSMKSAPLKAKKNIGVLPEDLALFDLLTMREHLSLSGQIYGLTFAETERRGEQLLKYLDLWESRHVFAGEASYGMKKKCAIAMALLHNPQILFLDEPFEGVDPVSSRRIRDLLLLLSSRGTTIFITSHILEIVERLVHSFAIIARGEIICRRTSEEMRREGETLEDLFFKTVEKIQPEEFDWLK